MNSDTPADCGQQKQWWPTKSTAFVVIHGTGPHRPFEALDTFVRGFWKSGVMKPGPGARWKHELKRRENWIESYISIVPEKRDQPVVDFYEYYWDCYMTRELTVGEAVDWIDQASAGARAFYHFWEDRAKSAPKQEKESWQGPGDWSKDGKKLEHPGYMILLHCLKVLPLIKPFMVLCWRRTSRHLDNYIGDVVTYTTSDVRSRNYNTRQKMLSEAVYELSTVLQSGSYEQVIVVGHSLGSIIAYDALNRIALDVKTGGGLCEDQASRLKGLVTLGSPLDKTAFYYDNRSFTQKKKARQGPWWRRWVVVRFIVHVFRPTVTKVEELPEPLPQQQIVSHLHSFRRIPLPVDPNEEIDIEDPIRGCLDNAAWLNFYHRRDLYSDCLYAYRGVKNTECTRKVPWLWFWKAHSAYWTWDRMYNDIAARFSE